MDPICHPEKLESNSTTCKKGNQSEGYNSPRRSLSSTKTMSSSVSSSRSSSRSSSSTSDSESEAQDPDNLDIEQMIDSWKCFSIQKIPDEETNDQINPDIKDLEKEIDSLKNITIQKYLQDERAYRYDKTVEKVDDADSNLSDDNNDEDEDDDFSEDDLRERGPLAAKTKLHTDNKPYTLKRDNFPYVKNEDLQQAYFERSAQIIFNDQNNKRLLEPSILQLSASNKSYEAAKYLVSFNMFLIIS